MFTPNCNAISNGKRKPVITQQSRLPGVCICLCWQRMEFVMPCVCNGKLLMSSLYQEPCAPGNGRPFALDKFRTLPEISGRDGRSFCRLTGSDCQHLRAVVTARIHSERPGLRVPKVSGDAGRDNGFIPAAADLRRRAVALWPQWRIRARAETDRA